MNEESSKKPLIITTIAIATTILALAAIAAILILRPFGNKDAVPTAISKLFSDGAPKYVQMAGSITTYDNNNKDSASLMVDFSSNINNITSENSVSAQINAALPAGESLSFTADEIHAASGNLYLKLNGVAEIVKKYNVPGIEVFDVVDNEWIQVPNSDFSNLKDIMPDNTIVSCLTGAAENLSKYGSSFAELYQKNPFIEYSTDNINIQKKNDTLYRLSFNADKLTAFINSMDNPGFANELLACTKSIATNDKVTISDLDTAIKSLPTIYAEINNNYDFTRVYMLASSNDGMSGAVADISFTYPSTLAEIKEPDLYIELGNFLNQLLSSFYNMNITE